jgi:hypothetical protein
MLALPAKASVINNRWEKACIANLLARATMRRKFWQIDVRWSA